MSNPNLADDLAGRMAVEVPGLNPATVRDRSGGTVRELSDMDALLRTGSINRTITAPEVRAPVQIGRAHV